MRSHARRMRPGGRRSAGKGLDFGRLQSTGRRLQPQADHPERGGGPGAVLEDLHAQHPVFGLADPKGLAFLRAVEVHGHQGYLNKWSRFRATVCTPIVWGMPARKEVLEVAGREVTVSNPDKVFFPKTGHTKLDLVRYYVAVADGALRGV